MPGATGPGTATSFSGFGSLEGVGQDSFTVLPGGSVAGGITDDGGSGVLAYVGGDYTTVQSVATAPGAGTVTADGTALSYSGIRSLTLPDPANTTVSVLGNGAVLQDAPTAGNLQLSSTASGVTVFAAPSQSLTVNLGNGTGGDVLTLQNIDSRLAGSLTINASGSGDAVNLDSNLATQGGAVTVTADTINVGAADTIDTRLSGGVAGIIGLTGKTISLATGSELRADPLGKGGTAADVTLSVADTRIRPAGLPIDFAQKDVSLDLEGATILGADVTLTATDSDTTPTGVVGTALGYVGDLVGFLASVPGVVAKAFPGIDASVVIRGADAHISVDNSTITGTGTVTLGSTTTVDSGVTAIANLDNNGSTNVSVAAGYAEATSTVDATVTGTSHITGAGDVTISATGTISASTSATAQANVQGTANNDASSVAIAIANVNLTDQATVGNQAVVTSTGGSVNVLATGSTTVKPSANTTEFTAGLAGVTAALSIDTAKVNAVGWTAP